MYKREKFPFLFIVYHGMVEYMLGYWVTYPYHRGVEEYTEIIMTSIGLVFVLEIDNWMFEIAETAMMNHVWMNYAHLNYP